jgi:hypothetical protein
LQFAQANLAGHWGAAGAAAGGFVVLLAFFALPVATVPFLGSLTSSQAAGFASELGVLGLLWLVPLAALGLVGAALWLILGDVPPHQRRFGAVSIAVLAGLVVAVYVILLLALDAQASEFGASASSITGGGFWIAILAAIGAGVGAGFELSASNRRPERPELM